MLDLDRRYQHALKWYETLAWLFENDATFASLVEAKAAATRDGATITERVAFIEMCAALKNKVIAQMRAAQSGE